MSRSTRSVGRDVTVASVVTGSGGGRRSRADSESGDGRTSKGRQSPRTLATKGQVEIDEAELLAGLGQVRQDDEQIVFQVVHDGSGGQQIVGQLCEESTMEFEEQVGEPVEEKPELTEEELQKELQALLDSQLEGESNSDAGAVATDKEVSKHLITSRSQLTDEGPDDDQMDSVEPGDVAMDAIEPTKGFTLVEIQAFMNNQIKKQHQQQILEEELENHNVRQQAASQGQQRHIILVTENGDKIILLQNPNDLESEETSEQMIEYTQPTEIDPEEEAHIQATTRIRQQGLMMQLEALRKRHKETLDPEVTTPAVPHLQPITLIPFPKTNGTVSAEPEDENSTEPWRPSLPTSGPRKRSAPRTSSSRQRPSVTPKARPSVEPTTAVYDPATAPKWLEPVINYLSLAQDYVKRREQKVDEVAKFFPSASQSFEKRCQELKKDFTKIDSDIERFKMTMSRDLNEVSSNFKSFLKDYHLESIATDMDAVDTLQEDAIESEAKRLRLDVIDSSLVTHVDVTQLEPEQRAVLEAEEQEPDDNDIIKELQRAAAGHQVAIAVVSKVEEDSSVPICKTAASASPTQANGIDSGEDQEPEQVPMTVTKVEAKSTPAKQASPPKSSAAKRTSAAASATTPKTPASASTTPSGRPKREATSRTPKWDSVIKTRGSRKSSSPATDAVSAPEAKSSTSPSTATTTPASEPKKRGRAVKTSRR